MSNFVKIEYLKNFKGDELQKATFGSIGYDMYASIEENLQLKSQEIKIIPSGLKLEFHNDIDCQIRTRSGLSIKGIFVINSPSTIDSDYKDEIGIIIANFSKETFIIEPGMRIAQMVFCKLHDIKLLKVSKINMTNDRCGGFGSTGLKELFTQGNTI